MSTQKPKKNPGIPMHRPTKEQRMMVANGTMAGLDQATLCALLGGIDAKTLRKHYRKELDTALGKALINVSNSLYRRAVAGSDTAAIWFEKSRGRKREHRLEDDGLKDANAAPSVMVVPMAGSIEEWAEVSVKAQAKLKADAEKNL